MLILREAAFILTPFTELSFKKKKKEEIKNGGHQTLSADLRPQS